MSVIIQSLIWIGVSFVLAAAGYFVVKWSRDDFAPRERLALGYGVGFGLWGILSFILGQWRIPAPGLVKATVGLGLLVLVASGMRGGLLGASTFILDYGTRLGRIGCRVGIAVCLVLLVSLTFSPPTVDDYDSIAYHFANQKAYVLAGRIVPLWFDSHSLFPSLFESALIEGVRDSVGHPSHWSFWRFMNVSVLLSIAAAAAHLAIRLSRKQGVGWLSVASLLSAPFVLWEATSGYVDNCSAMFVALGALAVVIALESQKEVSRKGAEGQREEVVETLIGGTRRRISEAGCGCRWKAAAVAGLMMGFGMGVKYSVIPIFGVMGLGMVVALIATKREWLKPGLAYFICGAAVASPWYIRNYVWVGNPVYPFYYEVFGGKNWNQHNADVYRASNLSFGPKNEQGVVGRSLLDFAQFPLNLVTRYKEYTNPVSGNNWTMYVFSLGPMWLLFLPLLLFVPNLGWPARVLTATGFVFIVIWFREMQYSRYLITILPLVAAVGAAAWAKAVEVFPLTKLIYGVAVTISLALSVSAVGSFVVPDRWRVAVGLESADDYLSRTLPNYALTKYTNENLPKGAVIAMFHDVLGLYLDREYWWANPEHHDIAHFDWCQTAQDVVTELRKPLPKELQRPNALPHKERTSHLWIYLPGLGPRGQEGGVNRLLREGIESGYFRFLAQHNGYALYELPPLGDSVREGEEAQR